jgi:Zn-dependent protease with chaperone function
MNWDIEGWFLYAITLLIEIGAAFLRYYVLTFIVLVISFILNLIVGISILVSMFQSGPSQNPFSDSSAVFGGLYLLNETMQILVLLISFAPLFLSIYSLAFFTSGAFLTRVMLGARDPSRWETERIRLARDYIINTTREKVWAPQAYYIIDSNEDNAFLVGTTLYLSRSIARSDLLPAILAHQYGHLNNGDGKLQLALRRLVLPPFYFVARTFGRVAPGIVLKGAAGQSVWSLILGGTILFSSGITALIGGGVGLWLLTPFWSAYWRSREFEADAFAHKLGQGDGLIQYLEEREQIFDVAVPFFISPNPPTEERIDRLKMAEEGVIADPAAIKALGMPAQEANRVARWAIIGATVLVLLFAALRNLTGGIYGDWIIVQQCQSAGCTNEEFRVEGTSTRVSFNGDTVTVASGNQQSLSGNVIYLTRDSFLIEFTQQTPIPLEGKWTIVRKDQGIELQGGYATYRLMKQSDIEQVVETTEEEPQMSPDVLLGEWSSDEYSLNFLQDGNLYINGVPFAQWEVRGSELIITVQSGKEVPFSFTINGNQLELNSPDGGDLNGNYTKV